MKPFLCLILCSSDKPSKLLSYLWVFTLVLNAQAIAIGSSIRYGFLTVSFSSRGIDGTTYGLVESSIGLGFALGFLSRKLISHMLETRKCNPKKVIVFCLCSHGYLWPVGSSSMWRTTWSSVRCPWCPAYCTASQSSCPVTPCWILLERCSGSLQTLEYSFHVMRNSNVHSAWCTNTWNSCSLFNLIMS